MEEERVDLRIPHLEDMETARKQAQLIFKLNHTMPMTEEYGSAKVASLTPEYDHVHGFLNMLDPSKVWCLVIRRKWLPVSLKAWINRTRRCTWYLVPRH